MVIPMKIYWSQQEKLIELNNIMDTKPEQKAPEAPERDWTKERDVRCMPVVSEIFRIFAKLEKLPINNDLMDKEEAYKIYFAMNKEIGTLLSYKDIDVKEELSFIFQAVEEIVSITKKLVVDSMEHNEEELKNAIYDVKEGEPERYTAPKLALMIEKKEEITEAIKKIIEEPAK